MTVLDNLKSLQNGFNKQSAFCRMHDAPFAADVLAICAQKLETSSTLQNLLAEWRGEPFEEALPLRLLGAWHSLALDGQINWNLEDGYLSRDDWPMLEKAISDHKAHFQAYTALPPQTNEVGRSAALMLGFLKIAERTGKPLALYEIGTSAGLNLRWDHYQYYAGEKHVWGDKSAKTKITADYQGEFTIPKIKPTIALRAGCDIAPIDIESETRRARLRSFVWPDHVLRRQTLEHAIETARGVTADITTRHAGEWVESTLKTRPKETAAVLFHSLMWVYLPKSEQVHIQNIVEEIGEQATDNTPFFHLELECHDSLQKPAKLVLRSWPAGTREMIAETHPHCRWIKATGE